MNVRSVSVLSLCLVSALALAPNALAQNAGNCAHCASQQALPAVQAGQSTACPQIQAAPPNPDAATLRGSNKGDRFWTSQVITPYHDVVQGFDCNWQPVVQRTYLPGYTQRWLWEMQWVCCNGRMQLVPVYTGISDQVPLQACATIQVVPGSQPAQPSAPAPQMQQVVPGGAAPPQVQPQGAPPASGGATVIPLGPTNPTPSGGGQPAIPPGPVLQPAPGGR